MPTSAASPRARCPRAVATVEEEGILIDDFLLIDEGRLCEAETRALLGSARWPARNIDQNLADLKAQVAARARGAQELELMVSSFGRAAVDAYMGHVQDNAEEAVRQVLAVLKPGTFALEMDDGAIIRVRIDVDPDARRATIDFTGTSAQRDNNFNAPLSITRAAVLYVFRTLVDDAIPLNAGCMKPLTLIVPEGSTLKFALSGRRGGRQCRDQPGRGRCPGTGPWVYSPPARGR